MSGIVTRTILASVIALICGCTQKAVIAPTGASPTVTTSSPNSVVEHPTPAVRAYIDPATGDLRDPTPEELAAEAAAEKAKKQAAAANQQTTQSQREVVLPDGAVEITLDKSTQHSLRACVQKNGDLKMDHECEAFDEHNRNQRANP